MNKYITHLRLLCLSLFLLLSISPISASSHSKDGKLDIQEILFGHINDSYEWHITDIGGHPVVLPLPIIVKSSTGFHVFLSNQFSEEHDSKGNRQGPYGLYISGSESNKDKMMEKKYVR